MSAKVSWLIFFSCINILSQQENYFYKEKSYGSSALFNPLNLILSSSYDIIQLENRRREIFVYSYSSGAKNVWRNLMNPFGVIKRTGVNSFITNELFPFEWKKKGAQWWPNYQLHLIGGGMSFTMLKEWYKDNNIPSAALISGITIMGVHFLNEVIENDAFVGDNVDPIADIYIFDLGGIILFSFDNVNKFFSEELNLADWSLQPSYNFFNNTLQNNGQYYSMKWRFPFSNSLYLFHYFGMNGLTGVSIKRDEESYSLGIGLRGKSIQTIDAATNKNTISLTWNVGLFYDKNNSLLASLFFSGVSDYIVNLNVYPGIISLKIFSPGLWLALSAKGKLIAGITIFHLPGLAF